MYWVQADNHDKNMSKSNNQCGCAAINALKKWRIIKKKIVHGKTSHNDNPNLFVNLKKSRVI